MARVLKNLTTKPPITIELTDLEARVLVKVLSCVGGSAYSFRLQTQAVLDALQGADVQPISDYKTHIGTLRFEDQDTSCQNLNC